jgi:hypothetical protein
MVALQSTTIARLIEMLRQLGIDWGCWCGSQELADDRYQVRVSPAERGGPLLTVASAPIGRAGAGCRCTQPSDARLPPRHTCRS